MAADHKGKVTSNLSATYTCCGASKACLQSKTAKTKLCANNQMYVPVQHAVHCVTDIPAPSLALKLHGAQMTV